MRFLCVAAMIASAAFGATVASTVVIGHDNSNKPIPRFSNGFMIFYERTRPAVTVYDREGKRIAQTVLQIEGADVINIVDVTADRKGSTITSASIRSHDGQRVVSALIWLGTDGRIQRVVRLDSFAARKLHVTPSGSLLALGAERDSGARETSDHQMVLVFSPDGRMISSIAHRSTFASRIHPSADGFLFSNGKSFGIFSPINNAYIEYAMSGQQTGKWTVPQQSRVDFTGGGLMESGEIFVGGQDSDTGSPFALKLDRSTGVWHPIVIPAKFAVPIGVEGGQLMLYGRPPSLIGLRP